MGFSLMTAFTSFVAVDSDPSNGICQQLSDLQAAAKHQEEFLAAMDEDMGAMASATSGMSNSAMMGTRDEAINSKDKYSAAAPNSRGLEAVFGVLWLWSCLSVSESLQSLNTFVNVPKGR